MTVSSLRAAFEIPVPYPALMKLLEYGFNPLCVPPAIICPHELYIFAISKSRIYSITIANTHF